MVTAIVKFDPPQLPAAPLVGVTVYVIVCEVFVALLKVCPILDCGEACALCPVIFALVEIDQMYVVFVGTISVPSVGVILNTSPLQIVTILFAMTGFGLTVVVTVNGAPLHDPLVGVTVYVAV